MYVYIIECEDGSLYTGIAKDVVQRLRQHYHHLSGCAKYTLSHQMKDIRVVWRTEDKVTACRLEYVRQKWECMHNCELCGKCHILKGRNAETLYADYIEGKRSYREITLEIR